MPYYGYGFGFDPAYMLLVLVSTVIGLAAQGYINSTYRTWSRVPAIGATGADVARRMLDANGCQVVDIKRVNGHLTDHYDPRDNSLHLSSENLTGGSVASVAVACHEAGHAAQKAHGYAMMKVRTALVPVVNFTQNTWMLVLMLGLFMNIAGLTTLAIALFSVSVLFQIVTLPVEFDASHRAMGFLTEYGILSENEAEGSRRVLRAAAMTYVAAAAAALLNLLRLVMLSRRDDRRD